MVNHCLLRSILTEECIMIMPIPVSKRHKYTTNQIEWSNWSMKERGINYNQKIWSYTMNVINSGLVSHIRKLKEEIIIWNTFHWKVPLDG